MTKTPGQILYEKAVRDMLSLPGGAPREAWGEMSRTLRDGWERAATEMSFSDRLKRISQNITKLEAPRALKALAALVLAHEASTGPGMGMWIEADLALTEALGPNWRDG